MQSGEDTRKALAERIASPSPTPPGLQGRGIVICAGGVRMFTNAYVLVSILRGTLKTSLPIEVWHFGDGEMTAAMRHLLEELGVKVVDAEAILAVHPARIADGWQLKPYALMRSPFAEVLLLDADQVPLRDPAVVFDWPEYKATGAVFWPDIMDLREDSAIWSLCGLPPRRLRSFESGQVLIDKRRHWNALSLTLYLNEESETFYRLVYGDKDTFLIGWLLAQAPYHLVAHEPTRADYGLLQKDTSGRPLFQHRTGLKWSYDADIPSPAFQLRAECEAVLAALRKKWAGDMFERPARSNAARQLESELAGALLRVAAVVVPETQVRLLENGDVGEDRTHDRQHWYVIDREGDLVLIFSNGDRETAWLRRDVRGGWRGRNLAPPIGDLFAVEAESEDYSTAGRRTLVDDLLDAAGLRDALEPNVENELRAALRLLRRKDAGVPARLREIAAEPARLSEEVRKRLLRFADELDETQARAPTRPVRPSLVTLRANYVDTSDAEA